MARVRSPADSVRAARSTSSGAEAELGQQAPGLRERHAGGRQHGVQQRPAAVEPVAGLLDLADHDTRPEPLLPRRQLDPAEQGVEQRRLAAAVRSDDADALGPADGQVDRAEGEVAPLDHRAVERRHEVAAALGPPDGEAQVPRLPRLVDLVQPGQRLLGLRAPWTPGSRWPPCGTGGGPCRCREGGAWPGCTRSSTTGAPAAPGRGAPRGWRCTRRTPPRRAGGPSPSPPGTPASLPGRCWPCGCGRRARPRRSRCARGRPGRG